VSARFAWDDSGLLIAVEVTDTTPSEAHLASAAYTADSLELFLATDPTKPDSVQLVLSPGRDPAHPAPRAYVFDNRPATLRALPNKVTWASSREPAVMLLKPASVGRAGHPSRAGSHHRYAPLCQR
jgi:hypothetical protein